MQQDYDYVIVGGGSAGAVLAARLTEDPAVRVLLLEAGRDFRTADTPEHIRIPNPLRAIGDDDYRWPTLLARRTDRQEPKLLWRGRAIGGSSTINGQIAIRGIPDDFERWAALGCAGWGWQEVLPYFRKLEDDVDFGDAPYHGRGGPIPVYRAPVEDWGHVDRALKAAAGNLGYPWCEDHNAPEGTGASPYAINSRDGYRVSTNDGYLEPARGRANLTIVGEALVDTLTVEGNRPHVAGVSVWIAGERRQVRATREVILSAGAIHSPAILQRSGIGPAAHLRSLGDPGGGRPSGRRQPARPPDPRHPAGPEAGGPGRHPHAPPHQLLPALFLGAGRGRRQRHDHDRRQPALGGRRRPGARAHRGLALPGLQPGHGAGGVAGPARRPGGRGAHAVGRARPGADARRGAPAARRSGWTPG